VDGRTASAGSLAAAVASSDSGFKRPGAGSNRQAKAAQVGRLEPDDSGQARLRARLRERENDC
jgi:hypothetical protein